MFTPRKSVSGLVALGALSLSLGAAIALAGPANAGSACGSSYPYGGYSGATDPNGFYAPDMRSYVAACVNAEGADFAKVEKGPNGSTGTFGSPGTWDATAAQIGFGVLGSPAVGLVAQIHSGEDVVTYDSNGKPNGTLTGGDIVAYVDQVYSGGQALVRTYDISTHQVRSFRIIAPRYLRLTGGQGVRDGKIRPTPSASPSAAPSKSASPSPKPSKSPSARPSPSTSTITIPGASLSPTPTVSVQPAETTPSDLTNKKTKTLAAKYGKAIALGGIIIALLLSIVVVAAARRTDDTGD